MKVAKTEIKRLQTQSKREITMKTLMSSAIANVSNFLKKLHLERILSLVLVVYLFLATNAYGDKPIGERIGEQQHETSVNSERPKTTGELLEEAEGDVPLNERIGNITRDSAEAFQQFGEGIGKSFIETGRDAKNAVTGK